MPSQQTREYTKLATLEEKSMPFAPDTVGTHDTVDRVSLGHQILFTEPSVAWKRDARVEEASYFTSC